MEVTGIILAGGKSSRMGEDKGLKNLNGRPMVSYIIDTLKQCTDSLIIIANNADYEKFNLPVIKDIILDKGPVGGIYTGLHHSKTQKNIIVSCDSPFVNKEIIQYLLDNCNNSDVTIPKYDNKTHPLIGIYKKDLENMFEYFCDNDELKLRDALKKLNTKTLIIDKNNNNFNESIFYNINTPTELKKY